MALLAATTAGSAATGFTAAGKIPGIGSARIWDVAVAPAQPSRIIVASDSGVFTSSDSGASWSLTLPGVRVWTVGYDARTASNAFAGTAGQGVYASTDGGLTWSPSSTGLPNQDVRALAFGLDGLAAGTDTGVAVSPDGKRWHAAGLSGYSISSVAVAANAPQFTVIAGADMGNLGNGSLFASSGGGPWQTLSAGLPASAVVTSISAGPIDAAVPKRPLLVTTSKGTFRSGDGGTTWTSSTGIPDSVTLTTATFDPLDPSVVYAGADAAGSTGGTVLRSTDGGQTFSAMTSGLPSNTRNVEAIAFGTTNPLTVVVALDPPAGPATVYTASDATVPAPPQLVPESSGAPVPTVVATPTPTPAPSLHAGGPAPSAPPPSGLQQFAQNAFHFPTPLLYEVLFVVLIVYAAVRWRQRYYIEGPP